MKRILFFLIITLCSEVSLCQEIISKENATTIKFAGTTNVNAMFFYADQFNDSGAPFLISNKQTEKKLEIQKPVLLFDATTGIPFYIVPGEELHMTATGGHIKLLSQSKERNNELAFFPEFDKQYPAYFKTNAAISLGEKINSVIYQPVQKFENEKEERGRLFLEQYKNNHPVSEEFYTYAQQFFHYLKTANLFSILSSATIQIKEPPVFLGIKDTASIKDYSCDSCIGNMIYRMSAYAYRQYLAKYQKKRSGMYLKDIYNITQANFAGKTKEFLLFITFKELLGKSLKPDDTYYIKYLNSQNKDNIVYIEYLKKEFLIKKSKSTKKELVNSVNQTTSWDSLIAKHRGKVIYIDFWASWCLPCRKELPDTKKLTQNFKNEQISVLYISADEKYNAWLNAVKSENINIENSFLITDFKNSELNKKFKIESLPRHVLIDKNGNIIDDHAPGSGSTELKKIIDKYL